MRFIRILIFGLFPLCYLATDSALGEYLCNSAYCVISMTTTSIDTAALELLDKYAENQDKLLSFIVKYQETYNGDYYDRTAPSGWNPANDKQNRNARFNGKSRYFEETECRYDGNRTSIRQIKRGYWKSPNEYTPKEQAEYISTLYDGKLWIRHNTPLKNLAKKHTTQIIPNPTGTNAQDIVHFFNTGLFMGYMEGDWDERVDSILRKAKSLKVREKPELINGSNCFVIDGSTRKGKYTLWIDPKHGYNLVKVVIKRRPGDIYYSNQPSLTKGYQIDFTIHDIRFEKIDNRWVPMELTKKSNQINPNGYLKYTSQLKRTAITFNPDFTNAFVPNDIPDDSALFIPISTAHVPAGTNYIWKNGKPCDKNGNPLDFSE